MAPGVLIALALMPAVIISPFSLLHRTNSSEGWHPKIEGGNQYSIQAASELAAWWAVG
jgi:hypothetical protein